MNELLPCPFCGGEAHTGVLFDGKTTVAHMPDTFCYLQGWRTFDTEAEAIEAWNMRTERTCYADGSGNCSKCGEFILKSWEYAYRLDLKKMRETAQTFNYCPNCGARVERREQ